MSDSIAATADNSTWVTLEIATPPAALFEYLKNFERLFRLNPYLDIKQWVEREGGKRFQLEALNEMNGVTYSLDIDVESIQASTYFLLRYSQGLKETLEITIQAASDQHKSILTLREHYHQTTQEQREQQLQEIDHSLIPWGKSIRLYILGLQRWAWFWPYRWYHEKVWLPMRPTHRRISRMLIWVTLLEFVVFLFVFIIYWLELAR